LRAPPASPSTSPMEQAPPPPSTRDGRHQRWREMPYHVVQPHHAPRCITWAGRPPESTPVGQSLVPACDWRRAATRGHTARRPCLSESQRSLRRRPTTLLGSIRNPSCCRTSRAPEIVGIPSCSRPLVGCLVGLACHTPCSFGTKTELESNSDAISARLRESWEFRLTFTTHRSRASIFSPCSIRPWKGSSVPVCPCRLTRDARRHMAIIRARPRWSGRPHLAPSPRRPLLVHCATSSASPPPPAFLRAPIVDPGADLVKPTRGTPLAMGIALPCIGHRFLDQGVVIASSRKRLLTIPSMLSDGAAGSSA
jgi:hypothetical protein